MEEKQLTEEVKPETEVVEEPKKEETAEILKEIRDRIGKTTETPAATGPTPEQIRAAIKERTGFSDEQIDHTERQTKMAVEMATAPLKEKLAWSDLRAAVGEIPADVKTAMDKELAQYPITMRGDSVLLDKVFYMVQGRINYKKGGRTTEETVKDEDVVERRVVSSTPGSSRGLSGGGSSSKAKLSDDEARMAKRFNMTDEEWTASKNTKIIGDLKKK